MSSSLPVNYNNRFAFQRLQLYSSSDSYCKVHGKNVKRAVIKLYTIVNEDLNENYLKRNLEDFIFIF